MSKHGYKSQAGIPASAVNSYKPQGFGYDDVAQGTGTRVWSNYDVNGKTFPSKDVEYRSYEGGAHKKKFRLQLQTELALAFINRHVDEPDPFFLYLAFYGPHAPLDAPSSLTDQVTSLKELEAKGYDNSEARYEKNKVYARDYTKAEVRQQGLALLKGIDNGVGDIVQFLEKKGVMGNTLIFFMGDNGAPTSPKSWDGSVNDPWHGSKGIIFEGGSRIPYFVHWKGVVPTQVFDKGVNTASIIQGKLKFMRHENGEELLFNVSMEQPTAYNPDKDFHESVNLIETMPEKATEFRNELESWMQTLPTPYYEGGFHSSLYEFIEKRWGFRQAP